MQLTVLAPAIVGSLLAGAPLVGPAPPAPSGPAMERFAVVAPFAGELHVLRLFAPPPVDRPWSRGHRGVDLAAEPWAPVQSAAGGTVTYAGPLAGRGVVVVAVGPLRWTYEPVRASVVVGQAVRAGERLGVLQPLVVHCHGRSCLHWGLREGQVYLDPLARLGRPADVRLLPLGPSGPTTTPALVTGVAAPAVGGPISRPVTRESGPAAPPPGRPPPRPPGAAAVLLGTVVIAGVSLVRTRRRLRSALAMAAARGP